MFDFKENWDLDILGTIKRDTVMTIFAKFTNIADIDIYKQIDVTFRINKGPHLSELAPEKLDLMITAEE